ncbi:S8 family peptidase [Pararobbsia alpina]|uniref:S8 family peptidase n=1 Tax=Pararobbsia alpina TaxID=621374 RepID=UPI001C2E2100|nr:S8 family peptidase [Pararobbsia alpina]
MTEGDPQEKPFTPKVLDRTAVAIPLLEDLIAEQKRLAETPGTKRRLYPVIIDLHLEYPGGRDSARTRVRKLIADIFRDKKQAWKIIESEQGINEPKTRMSEQYLFATLEGRVIQELIRRDRASGPEDASDSPSVTKQAVYRIWPDFPVKALLNKSISTVKADAALKSFSTTGHDIIWAVMDSGIDALHPHFIKYDNLNLSGMPPLAHRDLTSLNDNGNGALIDKFGHGTHVAGIIAGTMSEQDGDLVATTRYRDEAGEVKEQIHHPPAISGMAPQCKLLSLKVLDENGNGQASSLIAAIEEIQRINGYGRYIRVHGVNMSVGYDFEPEWFACGQSPLCVEVDRLVKSGVVVVVAAGNTGYGFAQSAAKGTVLAGLGLTINDPGNADLAITVGSTHRDMPHVYGVSYFSSKGPTGDGRAKPDLVAPGEKIVSCASAWHSVDPDGTITPQGAAADRKNEAALTRKINAWNKPQASSASTKTGSGIKRAAKVTAHYKEDSGTSMAAPHVSGVIAAFLSVRGEFIGRPERVKEVFLSTAIDLKRDRYFQGCGLVDLMRAIQSV